MTYCMSGETKEFKKKTFTSYEYFYMLLPMMQGCEVLSEGILPRN